MQPTETLTREHRVIQRMLSVVHAVADRIDAGEAVPPDALERMIDFIRNFADAFHHAKEEDLLFVRAGERGLPTEGGPIGVMLMEHDEGRGYVRGMADALERYAAGDDAARTALTTNARNYADLLARHIDKEDQILYPMIDSLLTPEDQTDLIERFGEVERLRASAGEPERFHRMVEEFEAAYGGR